MSTDFAVTAEKRELQGKGASRRLRRLQNAMPAVVYGANKPAQSIQLVTKDFIKLLENEAFFAHIIDISIDGTVEKVVLKDIQRHPVSTAPIHADFLRIDATHKITMKVPLHFINAEACEGVKTGGGSVNQLSNELEISCLAKDLPEYIEVDLINLDVGELLHISEITLPAGVESTALALDHDLALVTVLAPKAASTEEDDDTAAGTAEVTPE